MKRFLALIPTLSILVVPAGSSPSMPMEGDPRELPVAETLDDFHRAAAEADGERYFGHFTPDAVFLGTDAGERWSVADFRAYAEPYFSQGKGWTYVASARHIDLSGGGDIAWFDERLQNVKYGEVRGSGVLERSEDRWRIAQYNMSIPVPNDLGADLVERVQAGELVGDPRAELFHAQVGERRIALWEKVVTQRLELPPAERPVVVLLPSATFSARGAWDLPLRDYSVMDALAKRGMDVFAAELGGYGASSPPAEGSAGGAREAIADLKMLVERIRELRGVERVVLVGPSWGSQVAGLFAAEHPELVRGVVLYGFTWKTRIPEEVVREVFGDEIFEAPTRPVTRESALSDFQPGHHEDDVPEALAAHLLKQGSSVPSGALRDYTFELPLVDPGRLKAPCLVIAGRREFLYPDEEDIEVWHVDEDRRGELRDFYAQLPAERHWIEVPGGGHSAHLENPHRLFQLCLAGWIERLDP